MKIMVGASPSDFLNLWLFCKWKNGKFEHRHRNRWRKLALWHIAPASKECFFLRICLKECSIDPKSLINPERRKKWSLILGYFGIKDKSKNISIGFDPLLELLEVTVYYYF
jgi:hypothetical protein